MEGCVKAITTWSQEETMYTIIQSLEIQGVFIQASSHLQRLFGECMLESKCSNYCIKLHSLINFYKVLYIPSFGGIMLLFSICNFFLALFFIITIRGFENEFMIQKVYNFFLNNICTWFLWNSWFASMAFIENQASNGCSSKFNNNIYIASTLPISTPR